MTEEFDMQTCGPTQTPEDIDIDALREKYLARARQAPAARRARRSTWSSKGEFAEFYEVDPYTAGDVARRRSRGHRRRRSSAADSRDCWPGAHLKKAGVEGVRVIEMAGDFGGVWYWNRYPGIQCDNDAYCYIPLLEELDFMPSKKFADGAEIFEHCQRIGKHFGLYDGALFSHPGPRAALGRAIKRWRISTNRGDDIRARFVVMASGSLQPAEAARHPRHQGLQGPHVPHRALGLRLHRRRRRTAGWTSWPTSASRSSAPARPAMQLVPHLGRDAKQLYVFQRTPSSVDERGNPPTDPEWAKSLQPGWQEERKRNFHHWSPFEGVRVRTSRIWSATSGPSSAAT